MKLWHLVKQPVNANFNSASLFIFSGYAPVWNYCLQNLITNDLYFQFEFRATKGLLQTSDIAIDNISLKPGQCEGGKKGLIQFSIMN